MDGVPSRFACLQDDDSTDWIRPKSKDKSKSKSNATTSVEKQGTGKAKKKSKANNEAKELQQLAFQGSSKKTKNKAKTKDGSIKPSSNKEEAQYEAWKEKDKEFVDETYVQDIEKAILLSKIDFEEQEATKKIIEEECTHFETLELSNKSITMPLNQFNQLPSQDINSIYNGIKKMSIPIEIKHTKKKDSPMDITCDLTADLPQTVKHLPTVINGSSKDDFFKEIHQDAINMVDQEEGLHKNRNMSVMKNGISMDQSALMEQFTATVALKDEEIARLQDKNDTLSAELLKVKKRYKGMRSILDQAEIKEKADILLEAEKLRQVRDEMSENITQLTKELEQSKTKTQLLSKELRALQEKRSRISTHEGSHSTSDKN